MDNKSFVLEGLRLFTEGHEGRANAILKDGADHYTEAFVQIIHSTHPADYSLLAATMERTALAIKKSMAPEWQELAEEFSANIEQMAVFLEKDAKEEAHDADGTGEGL